MRNSTASLATKEGVSLSSRLNKVGIVTGIIGTIFGISWAIFVYFIPASYTGLNSEFYGIWSSKYSYQISNGNVRVIGTTELFRNGNYNFVGQIGIKSVVDNNSVDVLFDVDGAGVWEGDSKIFLMKLNDIKSYPVSLEFNSKAINLKNLGGKLEGIIPKLSDFIPTGISEQYDSKFLKNNLLKLKTNDPLGNIITILMKKTTKRHQRKRS